MFTQVKRLEIKTDASIIDISHDINDVIQNVDLSQHFLAKDKFTF